MDSDNGNIDLHIHSTASDGTLHPQEIIAEACAAGLKAVAITDHDSVEGVGEALASDIPEKLKFITGVELSVTPPESVFIKGGGFHMLGYGIDVEDAGLSRALETVCRAREMRNPKIIEKLNQLGADISMEEVDAESGGGLVGRPHIAKVLVKKGHASSVQDAFNKFIAAGKPAYMDKERIPCHEALRVIKEAGGIPVLAHPGLIPFENRDNKAKRIEDFILLLKSMGLEGVEVFYPEHQPWQTRDFLRIAEKHRLKKTGGTDFHGGNKPHIKMGTGRGDFCVPFRVYEELASSLNCNYS